ncbi:WD40 repeat-like protein [Terfezia boudieri ATCC MYA-4762]|uniref:DNA damage-binding protein CMR1 n=1 Tax=Terfezia boudieri ATCC MYA-4762 TaxID=1051890 RepID=A0A3N4LGW7_9PEZI|nr:WD40 repeat-like protein [Terfezia boudieri ATCC MYA-4762]
MKPKKEELDDENVRVQEGEEAQQDEDTKDTTGGADFNEYERQRQENIMKNKLLLQQLQLDSVALSSKPRSKPKPAQKFAHRKKKESSVSTTEHVPRRQSSRIAGLPADSEKAKRKYEEESAVLEQAERAKRMRVGGDINFDVGGIALSVKGPRYERTFTDEDVKDTDNMDVKKLREKMMGLKLYERWAPNDIKITPERVYYLGFHPTTDKQLIFAGDKLGTLGVWDASSSKPSPDAGEDDDGKELPSISEFKIHPRTISSFAFSPFSMNTILTASYDSSIRSFDLAKGLSTEVYFAEDEVGISGVEIHDDNPYLVYFSTLEGHMGRKDTRYKGKADVWQLSDKKIGGFSMHPKQTHLCVTASLDRTIKIWDLRNIVSGHKDDEGYSGPKPRMIGEHISRLSVSSAYWNRNGSIATTSYDDTVKIYRFPNAGFWAPGAKIPIADCGGEADGEVEPSTIIKHNNQTGRWVTIFRAQWQQNPRDGADKLVIGNMNRFLDIYAEDGTQLAQLGDDSLTAVPAAAQLHPTENWVAGGTASGKVTLFS